MPSFWAGTEQYRQLDYLRTGQIFSQIVGKCWLNTHSNKQDADLSCVSKTQHTHTHTHHRYGVQVGSGKSELWNIQVGKKMKEKKKKTYVWLMLVCLPSIHDHDALPRYTEKRFTLQHNRYIITTTTTTTTSTTTIIITTVFTLLCNNK